jgi:hypothetical protein
MRRLLMAGMALALLATALPSSVVTAHDATPKVIDGTDGTPGFTSKYNRPNYWAQRLNAEFCVTPDTFVAAIYKVSHTVVKGSTWLNVYNRYAKPPHVHTPDGDRGVSWRILCYRNLNQPVLNYGGRILGPCGDPFYTARIWNGRKSTRPVTIVLEVRGGRTLWKRTLQPGQSIKPAAQWVAGGKVLILRRGNGSIIDRERTVTGTFPWTECRRG